MDSNYMEQGGELVPDESSSPPPRMRNIHREAKYQCFSSCDRTSRGGVAASLLFLWMFTMLGLGFMKGISSPSIDVITTYFLCFWIVVQILMLGMGPKVFNVESRILVTSALITLIVWSGDMLWICLLVGPLKIFELCVFSETPTKEEILGDVTERREIVNSEGFREVSQTSDDSITIDSMNRV